METSAQRPAVDVGPPASRPGLALVLALLSVPGSTLAWDLPAGGLWIGLPLAIAAIALGRQARATSSGSKMGTAAVVIAALMILQMVVWTVGSIL